MTILEKTHQTAGEERASIGVNDDDIQAGWYNSAVPSHGAGGFRSYPATANKGYLKWFASDNAGAFQALFTNASFAQTSTITVPDPGASSAEFLLNTSAAGQSSVVTTDSATPGTIRAFKGLITETDSVMTSGNLVGVRGEVDCVGASGGFLYGLQGKVIPTGTLSGSSWTAGVFGQFDISAATINAGQLAPVWADYGTSSGTLTDVTGLRMFAGTNTTAAVLNAMDYRYGKASALLELAGDAGTYITSGAATPSGSMKKIRCTIDGVEHFLLAAAVWS